MKLSVFYSHVQSAAKESGVTEEKILKKIKSAGIDALDVPYEELDGIPTDMYRDKLGINIASVYRFYDWCGKEYGDDIRLKEHIDKAFLAGCKSVLIVPGFLGEEEAKRMNSSENVDGFMKNSESIRKIVEMLHVAVGYGKEKGIAVTLEDFDSDKSPCSRIPCLLWLLKRVDGLRITFDTGNFLFSGENIGLGYEALKEYIVHVHCKDRKEDLLTSCITGEGVIPLSSVIRDLKQNGYDGYFSIEHFGLESQEKGILSSVRNLKRLRV